MTALPNPISRQDVELTAYQQDAQAYGYQPRTVANEVDDTVPDELKEWQQWIIWQYQPNPRKPKPKKMPLKVYGGSIVKGDAADPETYMSFNDALAHYRSNKALDGIGFAFTESDPFTGVDLDECAEDGRPASWAQEKIIRLDSWTEWTPSGNGFHTIVKAAMEEMPSKSSKYHNSKVEMYQSGRFFTVTGHRLDGTPDTANDAQAAIEQIAAEMLEARNGKADKGAQSAPPASPQGDVPGSVQDVLDLIKAVFDKSGRQGERKFLALHNGGPEADDLSGDDMAYFNKLAFYCGKDKALMEAVYRQSALIRKKSERQDYVDRTIQRAIDDCTAVYDPHHSTIQEFSDNSNPPQAPSLWPALADPFAEYTVPAFPLDVLPEAFQTFAREKSEQSGFDEGAYAFCLLTAFGNTVDHRAKLNLGPFRVPAFSWSGLVDSSGGGKSPVMSASTKAAREIDEATVSRSKNELSQWMQAIQTAKENKEEPPPKPEWKQRHASDTTTEALAMLLNDNPEGVNLYFDEMTEFLGRMDAYSGKDGGKDRGVYLRSYDGGQVTINRATKQPLVVDNFSVGILAGVQPEVLAQKFQKSGGASGADGLYQRFALYCMRPPGEVDYMANQGFYTEVNVSQVFDTLTWLNDEPSNLNAELSPSARRMMQDYHNQVRNLSTRTAAQRFAEHLNKFPGMLGRLAFTLHLLDAAASEATPERTVGTEAMGKAIRVMRVLYRHSEAVYAVLDQQAGDVRALVVSAAEAILTKGWTQFKRGDLTRNATYWQKADGHQAEGAIDYLIELGWIADVTPPPIPGKRGRRSDGVFSVNPQVGAQFVEHQKRIKKARAERFKALQEVAGG